MPHVVGMIETKRDGPEVEEGSLSIVAIRASKDRDKGLMINTVF